MGGVGTRGAERWRACTTRKRKGELIWEKTKYHSEGQKVLEEGGKKRRGLKLYGTGDTGQ